MVDSLKKPPTQVTWEKETLLCCHHECLSWRCPSSDGLAYWRLGFSPLFSPIFGTRHFWWTFFRKMSRPRTNTYLCPLGNPALEFGCKNSRVWLRSSLTAFAVASVMRSMSLNWGSISVRSALFETYIMNNWVFHFLQKNIDILQIFSSTNFFFWLLKMFFDILKDDKYFGTF